MRSFHALLIGCLGSSLLTSCLIGSYTRGTDGDQDGSGGSGGGDADLGGGGSGGNSCKPRIAPSGLLVQASQGSSPYSLSVPAGSELPDGSYVSDRGYDAVISGSELSYDPAAGFWGWDNVRVALDDGCGGEVEAELRVRISPVAGGALSVGADATLTGFPSGSLNLGAADLNGDGRLDLVVGSPSAGSNQGTVTVIWGQADYRRTLDLADLPDSAGFTITGQAGDQLGSSVAGTGDIECVGHDSLLIGAPGNARAYLLGTNDGDRDLATQTDGVLVLSGAPGTGAAVAGGGDVNGDGIPDFAIGSPNANSSQSFSGLATVVFGGFAGCDCADRSACRSGSDLTTLNATPTDLTGFLVNEAGSNRQLGQHLAFLGNLPAEDGLDELGIASSDTFFRVPGQSTTTSVGPAGATLTAGASARSATAGNFDGDGITDFVVCLTPTDPQCTIERGGNPFIRYTNFPSAAGVIFGGQLNANTRDDIVFFAGERAWVVYGRAVATNTTTSIDALNAGGYTLVGVTGASLTGVYLGDWDGDGYDEFALADATNGTIQLVGGGP
ncbi:MAG TPA: FG-GAP repeat protein [Polyangiaceae bacterium]|nr:FG-GAP repeat protein [Polyangiaceae bacterium]